MLNNKLTKVSTSFILRRMYADKTVNIVTMTDWALQMPSDIQILLLKIRRHLNIHQTIYGISNMMQSLEKYALQEALSDQSTTL